VEQELRMAVLEALSQRPPGYGYELLELPGRAADDVERTVIQLFREGLVSAHHIPHGFGPGRDRVDPSTLTDKGHAEIQRLRNDRSREA
jgi:DNA-binding PadR family transcriptional regulator